MLRLLAQREQGYEDMASLMGVSVEELRSRVKDALAELEREGEAPPDLPPAPAADEKPQPDPEPEEPKAEPPVPKPPQSKAADEAPELSASPPAGEVPPPDKPAPAPKAVAPPAKGTPPPSGKSGGGSRLQLPKGKGARAGIAAVAAAIVVVVVLLLVLGGDGSDSSTTASTTTPTTAEGGESESSVAQIEAQAEQAGKGKEVTKAVLSGVGGGEGRGVAIFGRVKKTLALQVIAEGLEPTAKGQAYAIWLAQSPTKMLPLMAVPVNERGRIASQFEVPTEVLAYLANETFDQVTITLTSEAKLKQTLEAATKAGEAPAYTGTEVLTGTITGPIIGAATKVKGKAGE